MQSTPVQSSSPSVSCNLARLAECILNPLNVAVGPDHAIDADARSLPGCGWCKFNIPMIFKKSQSLKKTPFSSPTDQHNPCYNSSDTAVTRHLILQNSCFFLKPKNV